MDIGELKVSGGKSELLLAGFHYNVPTRKPEVKYEVVDKKGMLTMEQVSVPTIATFSRGNGINGWDLRLNQEVPIDFNLEFGSGRGELILGQLSLKRLFIYLADGQLNVDLSGQQTNDLYVRINAGEGRMMISLPRDVGIKVVTNRGVSKINAGELIKKNNGFENEAYGQTAFTIYLDIKSHAGEITLNFI